MQMFRTILLIALGGGIGSVFRYLTAYIFNKHYGNAFPFGTFITNILGCLLIGLFAGWLEKNQLGDSDLKWFFITGFCGGYTTFSAFAFGNVSLFQNNNSAIAFLYIGASIFAGLSAVWLGLYLTK